MTLVTYQRAHGRLAPKNLAAMLRSLEFVYPYRQVIGFYLQRAGGYTPEDLAHFRGPAFEHDFYLTYAMPATRRSASWRLHYPAELDRQHAPGDEHKDAD